MNGSEHALPIAEFAYNAKNANTSYMLICFSSGITVIIFAFLLKKTVMS